MKCNDLIKVHKFQFNCYKLMANKFFALFIANIHTYACTMRLYLFIFYCWYFSCYYGGGLLIGIHNIQFYVFVLYCFAANSYCLNFMAFCMLYFWVL